MLQEDLPFCWFHSQIWQATAWYIFIIKYEVRTASDTTIYFVAMKCRMMNLHKPSSGLDSADQSKPNLLSFAFFLIFRTEKAFDFSAILNTRATISYVGLVNWHAVRVFKSKCSLNMGDFPFDVQTCEISFHSQTQVALQLNLLPQAKVLQNFYVKSDEWDLVSATVEKALLPVPSSFSTTIYNFSVMDVYLKVARRTGYYWTNLLVPCMLISLLVTAVFAMPCEAGEKISFSVTILLLFTVYQLIVAETLPKTSEDTPILCK
jgi:hypothetical protein